MPVPKEFVIGEVFFPPLLIAAALGLAASWLTVRLLSHYRLLRPLSSTPLITLALAVIYTVLIGQLFIPF